MDPKIQVGLFRSSPTTTILLCDLSVKFDVPYSFVVLLLCDRYGQSLVELERCPTDRVKQIPVTNGNW